MPNINRHQEIDRFLKSGQRNAWLYWKDAMLYVRKSVRLFKGVMTPCIDIATIEVNEVYRGKGVFKEIRAAIESKGLTVFVENVMSQELEAHLVMRGYELVDESIHPHCYYLIRTEKNETPQSSKETGDEARVSTAP